VKRRLIRTAALATAGVPGRLPVLDEQNARGRCYENWLFFFLACDLVPRLRAAERSREGKKLVRVLKWAAKTVKRGKDR